jgi:hypothetical protein
MASNQANARWISKSLAFLFTERQYASCYFCFRRQCVDSLAYQLDMVLAWVLQAV